MKKIYFFSLLLVLSPTLVFADEPQLKVTLHIPGGLITENANGVPRQAYVKLYEAGGDVVLPTNPQPHDYLKHFRRFSSIHIDPEVYYYGFELRTRPSLHRHTVASHIVFVETDEKCLEEGDDYGQQEVNTGITLLILFHQSTGAPNRNIQQEPTAGYPLSLKRAHQPITLCIDGSGFEDRHYRLHIRFGDIINNALLPITFLPVRWNGHVGTGTTVDLPIFSVFS